MDHLRDGSARACPSPQRGRDDAPSMGGWPEQLLVI